MSSQHLIHIHAEAPPKPPEGAPCNGCGVCCLLEPCPLGALLSHRRRGACVAVQWDDLAQRYRCTAVTAPREALGRALPAWLPGAVPVGAMVLSRVASRWIALGKGCDSSVQIQNFGSSGGDAAHAPSDG